MSKRDASRASIESILAQAGHYIDALTGAISPPLQFSSTYARDEGYQLLGEYSYSRSDNPEGGVRDAERG